MLAFAAPPLEPATDKAVTALEPKVIAWGRDFQEHPELGNREVRTAKIVADYLKRLGMDVQTGVAHTGVKDRRSKATFFLLFLRAVRRSLRCGLMPSSVPHACPASLCCVVLRLGGARGALRPCVE